MDAVQKELQATPMLFPYPPSYFWVELRKVVQEEMRRVVLEELNSRKEASKLLYKVKDLCELFQVSKPTIYEWIREGRLKPFRIGSRVFFKGQEVEEIAGR
jgi:excisionase family DNA binding protein